MAIIVIEGIDAAGKKTIAARLAESIKRDNSQLSVEVFDFPHYNSMSGPYLRCLLTGEVELRIDSEFDNPSGVDLALMKAALLQSLMTMNRYEYSAMLVEATNDRNTILILDRYFASALAYGSEDGLPMRQLIASHHSLPKPDLSILIDISAEESMRRRPVREDKYESDLGFLDRVRQKYIELFCETGHAEFGGEWQVVDGHNDLAQVQTDVWNKYVNWSSKDRRC